MAVQDPDFSTDPSHGRTIDPDMVLNSGWVWMSLPPQQQYDPEIPMWPSISSVCVASMVTGTSDISTDPGCSWDTDPHTASGRSLASLTS